MPILRCIFLVVALLFATAGSAQAADYYLSPSGSGSTCSLGAPCGSISTASAKPGPGDTLYVRGGTYTGVSSSSWALRNGTSNSSPVTVKAYPGETPVFDGGFSIGEWMIPSGAAYQVLDGLTVQRYDNVWGNGAITPSNGTHDLEIRNMRFFDNGAAGGDNYSGNDHDIYIGGCSESCRVHDIRIHHNTFKMTAGAADIGGGALHLWHYREGYNISFYDNTVLNKGVGVYVCDAATNVRIYHNTFVNTANTGGRGTFVTGCGEQSTGAESLYIRNNIIYRAGGPFWERGGPSQVEDHNVWYCTGSCSRSWTLDATDKTSNPLLVNVSGGDYHLQSGSPAIDAGTSTDAASTDFDYVARPKGNGFDIGAFESGGTGPPPPPGDTTAPTAPSNLVATSPSCTDGACIIHVTWTASTDNVGVDHYVEYRPLTTQVGTDPGNATSTDFGGSLPRCSTQTMGLKAVDAAGNVSPMAQVTASTFCPSAPPTADFTWAPAPITTDPFTLTRATTCGSPPCTYDWTITLKVTDSTGRTSTVTHNLTAP